MCEFSKIFLHSEININQEGLVAPSLEVFGHVLEEEPPAVRFIAGGGLKRTLNVGFTVRFR
jgi:hypothetical protein